MAAREYVLSGVADVSTKFSSIAELSAGQEDWSLIQATYKSSVQA